MRLGVKTHSGGATRGKDVIVAVTDEVEGHTVYGVPMFLFDAARQMKHHNLILQSPAEHVNRQRMLQDGLMA